MKTKSKNLLSVVVSAFVALLLVCTMFTFSMPAKAADLTVGTHTFNDVSSQWTQDGTSITTSNTKGWKHNFVLNNEMSGSYYGKFTVQGSYDCSDHLASTSVGNALRIGVVLWYGSEGANLTAALKWYPSTTFPDHYTLHEIAVEEWNGSSSTWTSFWYDGRETGVGALKPSDLMNIEFYRQAGDSVDTFGLIINGETVGTASASVSVGQNGSVGIFADYDGADQVTTGQTVTFSNFLTMNDAGMSQEPTITLAKSCPTTGEVGTRITLPGATVEGKYGVGGTYEVAVTLNGAPVTVTSRKFTPSEAGTYAVVYTGTDIWGKTVTLERSIEVSAAAADDGEGEGEGSTGGEEGETTGGAGCGAALNANDAMGIFSGVAILAGVAFVVISVKKKNA